jgi:hypothetical protein
MVKKSSANIVAHGSIRGYLGWGLSSGYELSNHLFRARELGGLRGGHDGVSSL